MELYRQEVGYRDAERKRLTSSFIRLGDTLQVIIVDFTGFFFGDAECIPDWVINAFYDTCNPSPPGLNVFHQPIRRPRHTS